MTVGIHRHVDDVPAKEWDEVAAVGGLYSSSTWLRLSEQRFEPRYVTVGIDGRLVAGAAVYIARTSGEFPDASEISTNFMVADGVDAAADPIDVYPFTLCGPMRGYSSRLLIRRGLDGTARRHVLARLLHQVKLIASEARSKSWGFGYLPLSDAEELAAVDAGLGPVFAYTECTMPVPSSFEDYLRSFRHHPRRRILADIKNFEAAGLVMETRSVDDVADRAAALIAAHEKKYGLSVDPAVIRRGVLQTKELGRFLCFLKDGAIVGVEWGLVYENVLYGRALGFDEDAIPRKAAVYFNCIYSMIRASAQEGLEHMHHGIGSVEAKVSRGCRPRPLWFVLGFEGDVESKARARLRAVMRPRLEADLTIIERYRTYPCVHECAADWEAARALVERIENTWATP